VRAGRLIAAPLALIRDRVREVARTYSGACGGGAH
jgi:hypothetical protein